MLTIKHVNAHEREVEANSIVELMDSVVEKFVGLEINKKIDWWVKFKAKFLVLFCRW